MSSDDAVIRQQRIGARLKKLRISNGYTNYRKFSVEFELEPKQYWRLEEGKSDFKISSLFRILDIHGLSIQEFLMDVDLGPDFEENK